MTPLLISVLLFATLVVLVVTVAVLQQDALHRKRLLAAVDAQRTSRASALDRADAWLIRTRRGQRVTALLAGSGLSSASPTLLLLLVAGAALLAAALTYAFAGKIAAVIIALVVVLSFRQWLEKRREARIERFIGQLPEFARLLANGAQAGLGVRRSIELAAKEMDEPARGELAQVASEMAVGQTLQGALNHLAERLPSRELVVLVQTLVIQGKAGGALVTALQNIATTLEERRQLRREAKTAVVGAAFSGYAVVAIAGFAVILMNLMSPGALDTMLRTLAGQIAMVVAAALFTVGFIAIQRLSKVKI
ncbi:type II secretion system F family protein [Cellulomonas sp. URHB0016]